MTRKSVRWIGMAAVAAVAVIAAMGSSAGRAAAQAQGGASRPPAAAQRAPGLYWTFETDLGDIHCKLFENESPITVGKMVGLAIGKISYIDPRTQAVAKKKFFDGLTFHRVIPQFMIQGGDPLGNGTGSPEGPGFPYQNERSPDLNFDVPGRLAMANAGPDTNGSQFFITEVPYPSLNQKYTIWGQCEDLDVVNAIARVQRDDRDKPLTPVHIKRVIIQRIGPVPPNAPEAMPSAQTSSPVRQPSAGQGAH